MDEFECARTLLHKFKGDRYFFGLDVLSKAGKQAVGLGRRALLVRGGFEGIEIFIELIRQSMDTAGVEILSEIHGAAPNAPREDVKRISDMIRAIRPDVIVSFGSGSTIDAVKAADALAVLDCDIQSLFGTGQVSRLLDEAGVQMHPHLAIQTAASSSAHLTRYSNISDVASGQKKLIVDDSIIPQRALFDYKVTFQAPRALTLDGGMDGLSHALEVLYSMVGKAGFEEIQIVSLEAVRLILKFLPQALEDPENSKARQALGLGTDLGGYAIMLGGTNGAHLNSFSLVDILSHGRACGLLNPYYTVFFSPAIECALQPVARLYRDLGYLQTDPSSMHGRQLGEAVADAMFSFAARIGAPITLQEVRGFSEDHLQRALSAAKTPELGMKLGNMPVPMDVSMVDEYMAPVLQAAITGDISLIKNVS
jgi:alcohol dehydrogenase